MFLAILLLAMANDASSQDEESREKDKTEPELTLSALGEYQGFLYLDRRDPNLFNGRNAIRLLPEAAFVVSPVAKLEGAVELRKDFIDPSRSRVFLDKGYLDLDFEAWDLRVGRQTISGGRASAVKPTDSFMRHDFTDFLAPEEEPIDAVKVDGYLGDWTLQGVWAPVFRPDIFSFDPRNRWIGPILGEVPGPGLASEGLVVDVDHSSEPPRDIRSSQLGVRVIRRSGGVDWSASYYWGYDRLPTYLEPGPTSVDPVTGSITSVVVRPFYERIQIAGVDGETFIGPWGLRGEAAYTITSSARAENPPIDDPYLRLVVGVNRTFSRILSTHDLYLNGQFLMDREVPSRGMDNQDIVNVRLRHFFRYALTTEVEYRFNQFHVVRSQAFLDLQQGDYVVQVEFRWQPRDAMTWTFGSDLVGGPTGSFFGPYRRNDRVRVDLTLHLPRWQPGKTAARALVATGERR